MLTIKSYTDAHKSVSFTFEETQLVMGMDVERDYVNVAHTWTNLVQVARGLADHHAGLFTVEAAGPGKYVLKRGSNPNKVTEVSLFTRNGILRSDVQIRKWDKEARSFVPKRDGQGFQTFEHPRQGQLQRTTARENGADVVPFSITKHAIIVIAAAGYSVNMLVERRFETRKDDRPFAYYAILKEYWDKELAYQCG